MVTGDKDSLQLVDDRVRLASSPQQAWQGYRVPGKCRACGHKDGRWSGRAGQAPWLSFPLGKDCVDLLALPGLDVVCVEWEESESLSRAALFFSDKLFRRMVARS